MMELFVAWIPLLALVGLALTIWCLYQRFRRAALGWAAATVCILLCAVWWYAPFHVRLAAEESVLVNYEDDRHSERLVPGRDDPALAQLTEQVEALSFRRPFFHDTRTNDVGQRLAFCVSCKGPLLQFVPPTEQEAAYAVTREGAIAEVPQELFDFLDQLSP